jgi:recombination protein RecT
MSTELAKADTSLKGIINSDAMREQFARALPKHLTPERFARIAITALTRTPKLQDCTKESVMKCLLDCSAMGIEPDNRKAYLIPYGRECTLIVSYMGLVELIRRSGDVVSIRAETVCEKDEFAWIDGQVSHRINWREDRGAVQAVYAEAIMKSGEKQTAVMTKAEVEAIRKKSKAGGSGPWVDFWSEMAKKTAVRRLSKMLPLASEIMDQVSKDDEQFSGMRNVTRPVQIDPFAKALPEPTPEQEADTVAADMWEGDDKP